MKKLWLSFRKIAGIAVLVIERANHALIALPAFFAVVMTVLITVNVAMRYVFNQPLAFEFEAVQVMLLTFVWLTQGYIFSQGRSISVDFVATRLGPRTRIVINIIGCFIGILYFGMIAKVGWGMASKSFENGARSIYVSQFPIGPQQLVLSVGAGLACLQLLVMMGHYIVSLTGRARHERRPGKRRPGTSPEGGAVP